MSQGSSRRRSRTAACEPRGDDRPVGDDAEGQIAEDDGRVDQTPPVARRERRDLRLAGGGHNRTSAGYRHRALVDLIGSRSPCSRASIVLSARRLREGHRQTRRPWPSGTVSRTPTRLRSALVPVRPPLHDSHACSNRSRREVLRRRPHREVRRVGRPRRTGSRGGELHRAAVLRPREFRRTAPRRIDPRPRTSTSRLRRRPAGDRSVAPSRRRPLLGELPRLRRLLLVGSAGPGASQSSAQPAPLLGGPGEPRRRLGVMGIGGGGACSTAAGGLPDVSFGSPRSVELDRPATARRHGPRRPTATATAPLRGGPGRPQGRPRCSCPPSRLRTGPSRPSDSSPGYAGTSASRPSPSPAPSTPPRSRGNRRSSRLERCRASSS